MSRMCTSQCSRHKLWHLGKHFWTFQKCTKFDQLILRKIIKIVATRCQILTLKCTKSALPDPLAGFKGTTSNGREREGREGKEGEGRGSEGRGGDRRGGREEKGRREGKGEGRGGGWEGRGAPPLLILQFNHCIYIDHFQHFELTNILHWNRTYSCDSNVFSETFVTASNFQSCDMLSLQHQYTDHWTTYKPNLSSSNPPPAMNYYNLCTNNIWKLSGRYIASHYTYKNMICPVRIFTNWKTDYTAKTNLTTPCM